MIKIFTPLHILKFSGISTILGIDSTSERVHCVEIQFGKNFFKKKQNDYTVLNSFSHTFAPQETTEEKIAILQNLFKSKSIHSRYAVSTIQSIGVKSFIVDIPSSVKNIEHWVEEHWEKLLKIPISRSHIQFTCEILVTNPSFYKTEITFVKKSDIEYWIKFFKSLGIELLLLTAGSKDAANVLQLYPTSFSENNIVFIHKQVHNSLATFFVNGNITGREEIQSENRAQQYNAKIFIADENEKETPYTIITPLGTSPKYTLAVGLVIGFFSKKNNSDFRTDTLKISVAEKIQRLLFRRAVAFCGIVLLVLLSVHFIAETYLHSKLEALDERYETTNTLASEITVLEQQIKELQQEGNGTSLQRTNVAMLLHRIAEITHNKIWLYKCIVKRKTPITVITLYGYSTGSEEVTKYLTKISESISQSTVKLVRYGVPLRTEPVVSIQQKISSPITFEINIETQIQ